MNSSSGFGEVQLHNSEVFRVTRNLNTNGAEISMKQRYPKVQLGSSSQKEGRPVAIRYRTLFEDSGVTLFGQSLRWDVICRDPQVRSAVKPKKERKKKTCRDQHTFTAT